MNAVGIIYSNIYDSRLSELTKERTVASLPFAARYRVIDFILSDMTNSGIGKIGVITKYNYQSLMDHLGSCKEWDLNIKNRTLKIIAPYAMASNRVYRGKLDALANAFDFLSHCEEEYVILAESTIICAIDFDTILQQHIASGADMTAVFTHYESDHEMDFSMAADISDGKIKTLTAEKISNNCMAGMGIYVMKKNALVEATAACVEQGLYHFERDFVLREFNEGKLTINPYVFQSKVLFNTSTLDYYRNSMALLDPEVTRAIFERKGFTIYTKVRDCVPAYYGENSNISNCLVADGCKLMGTAADSVLFRDVQVAESAVIKDCIIMQGCKICEGAILEGIILDKDVTIRPYTVLKGTKEHPMIIEKGATI